MYYKRITAQSPISLEAGLKAGGEVGGQRKREDKAVVICLFNWLTCLEENCVVILAGRGPSARLWAGSVRGCRGVLGCLSPRRGSSGGQLGRLGSRQRHVVRGCFCFSSVSEISNNNPVTEIEIF